MTNIVKPLTVWEPPALEIDKILYAKHEMPSHGKVERRIVYNLLTYLYANGWAVHSVYDGDDFVPVLGVNSVMEICFDLDECSLRCRPFTEAAGYVRDAKKTIEHGIALIFGNGNNGLDLISDYSYSETDNFREIMDAFEPEDFA